MKTFLQVIKEQPQNDKLDRLTHNIPLSNKRLKQLQRFSDLALMFDFEGWQNYPPPSNSSKVAFDEINYIIGLQDFRDQWETDMVMHDEKILTAFKKYLKKHDLEVDLDPIRKIKDDVEGIILSLKRHYNRPRPKALANKLGIGFTFFPLKTAETPSYPSGHSTQGRLVAKLIADEVPFEHRANIIRIGEDIGEGRMVAGAHYPSDHEFGQRLADELYRLAKSSTSTLKLESLLTEIEFSNKAAFQAYNAKHKMRPTTKVKISGKDTTAKDADPDAFKDDEKDKEEPKDKKSEVSKDKPQEANKKQQASINKINKKVVEDLDFIIANAEVVKIKGGAGSNTPTREEAIALKDFTEKRMEQDERRKEAEEKGKPFDEEPYVHANVVQREIDDETLDASMDYLKEQLGEEGFANFIQKQSTGGAVNPHLTKLTKKERGKVGWDENSPGYTRVKEQIRLYLKNDGKSVVTGEPLPFSNMEVDHRIPYGSAEEEAAEKMGISTKEVGRLLGPKKNLSKEDLKKREELDSILVPAQQKLDDARTNVDMMEIGCNQLKGSAMNEELLNKIKKQIAKNPEVKRLQNEYKDERQKLLNNHYRDEFGRGDFSSLNEKDISQMDTQETNALMKGFNYYHPSKKEFDEQLNGVKRKGIEGDPEYYNKLKEYWKGQGVELPENSDDIDYDKPPFNKWMNRYIAPKKARGRGGAARRSINAERKFIQDHMRENDINVPTIEEIDKEDRQINEAREKIRKNSARKQIDIENEKLKDPKLSDRQKSNIEKKLEKLKKQAGIEEKMMGFSKWIS